MLYKRIIEGGTINEPDGKPEPQFALPSTVNWMRALSILASANSVSFASAKAFYTLQPKRSMGALVENTVLEQLFLSLHHLSALERLKSLSPSADFGRLGILAWYYGIANAASAMTAAQSGAFQEDHAGTARMWDADIAARGLAMAPFSWRVSSLKESSFKVEVSGFRAESTGSLLSPPNTPADALGVAAGYLSGTAKWYAWRATEEVRKSPSYKALGVDDFRTRAARELRDERLISKTMGFVHQASRYRGKANYREALFLAYGASTETIMAGFVWYQAEVLRSFVGMAGAFASQKLGPKIWEEFVADVDRNRAFTTSAQSVWS